MSPAQQPLQQGPPLRVVPPSQSPQPGMVSLSHGVAGSNSSTEHASRAGHVGTGVLMSPEQATRRVNTGAMSFMTEAYHATGAL